MQAQRDSIQTGKKNPLLKKGSLFTWAVPKTQIAESGDYNLSGDRYNHIAKVLNHKWEAYPLKEVCKVDWGNTTLTKSSYVDGGEFLAVSDAGADGKIDYFEHNEDVTVISAIGANCGRIFYPGKKFTAIKNTITLTPDKTKILPKFLYWALEENQIPKRGGGQPFVSKGDVEKYKISLPPLEVQKEIADELDSYQKVIDGAKQIIAHHKPSIKIDPKWKVVGLKDIAEIVGGFAFKSENLKDTKSSDNELPVVKIGNVTKSGAIDLEDVQYHKYKEDLSKFLIKKGDLLVAMTGATVGKVAYSCVEGLLVNQRVGLIRAGEEVMQEYLKAVLLTDDFYR
ncbi:MAG: restriction endonuclease subunit S, partial [Nanoarchaeota archaeon]